MVSTWWVRVKTLKKSNLRMLSALLNTHSQNLESIWSIHWAHTNLIGPTKSHKYTSCYIAWTRAKFYLARQTLQRVETDSAVDLRTLVFYDSFSLTSSRRLKTSWLSVQDALRRLKTYSSRWKLISSCQRLETSWDVLNVLGRPETSW